MEGRALLSGRPWRRCGAGGGGGAVRPGQFCFKALGAEVASEAGDRLSLGGWGAPCASEGLHVVRLGPLTREQAGAGLCLARLTPSGVRGHGDRVGVPQGWGGTGDRGGRGTGR